LVAQLQDHLDNLWHVPENPDASVTKALTTRHPLQPFSRAYFPQANSTSEGDDSPPKPLTEVLQARSLFTYEREWRSAHSSHFESQQQQALPYQEPEEPITFNDLAQFLKRPIDTFYQRRLQVRFEAIESEDTDNENFDLNGLDRWRLDNELIQHGVLKAGSDEELRECLDDIMDRMARRGDLGMGITEQRLRPELAGRLPDLFERYQKALTDWPAPLAEPLAFAHRYRDDHGAVDLVDLIDGLRQNASGGRCRLVIARSSLLSGSGKSKKVRYANLMADWIIHLAGQLTEHPFDTLILGKEEGRNVHFPALAPEQARGYLDTILRRWMQATTRALPLQCDAGFAWVYSFYQSRDFRGNHERAIQASIQAYNTALQRDTGYLRGAYESADDLQASGEFEALLHDLYVPVWEAEQGKSAAAQIEGSL
jgi:exodeoxyribonuclease V gamma subunit